MESWMVKGGRGMEMGWMVQDPADHTEVHLASLPSSSIALYL